MQTGKWQYKTHLLKTGAFSNVDKREVEMQESLNRLGVQGWNLVSVSTDNHGRFWGFLKKPL